MEKTTIIGGLVTLVGTATAEIVYLYVQVQLLAADVDRLREDFEKFVL